jgi:hypothetical protein
MRVGDTISGRPGPSNSQGYRSITDRPSTAIRASQTRAVRAGAASWLHLNASRSAILAVAATASAEMKWINGWSAAATFEGEFSEVTRSYAGKGVMRYAW